MSSKPTVEITGKGFKIIRVNIKQIIGWGGLGICDSCNKSLLNGGVSIGALNRCYCNECFDSWHARAKYYPEDSAFENRNIAYTLSQL